MNILWLYRYIPEYDFDHHLHMSFAKFIASYPGVNLKAYGPRIEEAYPLISLCAYDAKHTMQHLWKIYKYDVVIICTKSRCIYDYEPKYNIRGKCWLPLGFEKLTCPKIVLEEDYHYEQNDEWYKDFNIDLILQRHYSQVRRQQTVPMSFFPFSVDLATFNPWKTECIHQGNILSLPYQRIKKFCFVGSCGNPVYHYRRMATELLATENLVDDFKNTKHDGEYIRLLRMYVGYVSCGSVCEITAAKNFEIMASGGLLFTNEFEGINEVFPQGSYLSYNNDGSDVIDQAKEVLNNSGWLISMVKTARECIKSRHTHDTRLEQLLRIIRNMK